MIFSVKDTALEKVSPVKAVLMTFNYQNDNCRYVYRVTRGIENNIDELRNRTFENSSLIPIHEKWTEIDIYADLPGWERYQFPCIRP